ncbi:putative acyltransferase YihG [compost metagenome]
MGEQLHSLVNVTIHYPQGNPGFWQLLSGEIDEVVVSFNEMPIPPQFIGRNYDQDEAYRRSFQQWVNQLWQDKDAELERLHRQFAGRR